MSLTISTESVPLYADAGGVARVGGTRVSLDSVVFAFNEGSTPEEIVQQYTALDLADVYAVIGYYLRHRGEVDEYIAARLAQRDESRREVESRFDPHGVRARLLARRQKFASADAALATDEDSDNGGYRSGASATAFAARHVRRPD